MEPYLNFNILDTELINILDEPDVELKSEDSVILIYKSKIDGVTEHVYYLLSYPDTPDEFHYYNVDVRFNVNQHNFEFILSWLTNKYGNPEISENMETNIKSYNWRDNSTAKITLSFIFENSYYPETSILKLNYFHN